MRPFISIILIFFFFTYNLFAEKFSKPENRSSFSQEDENLKLLEMNNPEKHEVSQVNNRIIRQFGLTENTIKFWLSKSSKNQKYNGEHYYNVLSDKLYTDIEEIPDVSKIINPECIKIVDKGTELGGTYTTALFFVFTNSQCLDPSLPDEFKLKLIIKDLFKGEYEINNLRMVESSVIGKLSLDKPSFEVKNLPKLAFTEEFFKFKQFDTPDAYESFSDEDLPDEGIEHFFSIIHAAKGKTINEILERGTNEEVEQAFSSLGRSIGQLHAKFLNKSTLLSKEGNVTNVLQKLKENESNIYDYYKTFTHGDLHWNNAFYDKTLDRIILIDNESFAISLSKNGVSLITDLENLYNVPIYSWEQKDNCEKGNFCHKLDIALPAFFRNYTEQFPISEREFLLTYIAYFLKHHTKQKLFKRSATGTEYEEVEPYYPSIEAENYTLKVLNEIVPSEIINIL